MTTIKLSVIAMVTLLTAISCNKTSNKIDEQKTEVSTVAEITSTPDVETESAVSNTISEQPKTDPVKTAEVQKFSLAPIIKEYLALKNALAKDDTNTAGQTAEGLYISLKNADVKTIPAAQLKEYKDIVSSAKENAEHIGKSVNKMDHQREHFASLSRDINDLIGMFGAPQKLYQDHCPMYNDGKGAIWISESKEIKNPYYGSEMISCGSLKKSF